MLSQNIIDSIIKIATPERKDKILKMFINNINDYSGNKIPHILDLLVNPKSFTTGKSLNMDWITNHMSFIVYHYENYNIKDITIDKIDELNGDVYINYKRLEKINEDREDVEYESYQTIISFIDNPEVLK